jgi:hypothetical protein
MEKEGKSAENISKLAAQSGMELPAGFIKEKVESLS